MKIVVLERHSAGTDITVDYSALGDCTYYRNTSTKEEVIERIKEIAINNMKLVEDL